MTIADLRKLYSRELSSIYNTAERAEIFFIFLKEITGLDRLQQRTAENEPLAESEISSLKMILQKLKSGKPYQQILGKTEFYGTEFFVDEHVLIPRPETEELLELAVGTIKMNYEQEQVLKILDIGTGSGIIAIILKLKFPHAQITAVDFSKNALKTAKKNADFHQVEIDFVQLDYLSSEPTEIYDILISNPPYIGLNESEQLSPQVKNFEPTMALFSPTDDPLLFYRKIAEDCKRHLATGGFVFLEINQKLGKETAALFADALTKVHLEKDLSGNLRFVWGRK